MSKRLGGIKRLQIQNHFFMAFSSPMEITGSIEYNSVREKPIVTLYTTYINRHAGTPKRQSKNRTETMYVVHHAGRPGSSEVTM